MRKMVCFLHVASRSSILISRPQAYVTRRRRMNPPLVSVVAIFLNGERFLDEALQSVIGQTYPHWELLLVDDGSRDRSAGARAWLRRTGSTARPLPGAPRPPQPRDQRVPRTRAAACPGEYLALLDADDVWLPGKLARQVEILEAHPAAGLLFGAPLYWFGWTGNPRTARATTSSTSSCRSTGSTTHPTCSCPSCSGPPRPPAPPTCSCDAPPP